MFRNYQDIEYQDECKWSEEAKDENVESESGLPVDDLPRALPEEPDDVATVSTVASDRLKYFLMGSRIKFSFCLMFFYSFFPFFFFHLVTVVA